MFLYKKISFMFDFREQIEINDNLTKAKSLLFQEIYTYLYNKVSIKKQVTVFNMKSKNQ